MGAQDPFPGGLGPVSEIIRLPQNILNLKNILKLKHTNWKCCSDIQTVNSDMLSLLRFRISKICSHILKMLKFRIQNVSQRFEHFEMFFMSSAAENISYIDKLKKKN